MRRALGLALTAVMVVVPTATLAIDDHPNITSDERWCAQMLPGTKMAPAREKCVAFLQDIRANSIGVDAGEPPAVPRAFMLPDTLIVSLVWSGVETLGVEDGKGSVKWKADGPVSTRTPAPEVLPTPRPSPALAAMSTWPNDTSLQFRFLEPKEYSCNYGSCHGVLVKTRDGCPNGFYAEAQVLDGTGTVLGYTNVLGGRLTAGQQAELVFHTFEEGAERVQISELNCY